MRITLLGVLVGMAAALLLVYVVQRVQEANEAKAETNEQSQSQQEYRSRPKPARLRNHPSLSPCSTLTRLPPCCASTPRLHRSGRERARFPPSTTVTAGCFAPQNWIPGSDPKYTYPAMRAANRRKFDEASTLSVWLFATETEGERNRCVGIAI